MKKISKIFSFFIITSLLFGCSDDYFDVNKPGDAIDSKDVALNSLLGPTILETFQAQYSASTNVSQVNQHIASAFGDQGVDNHYQDGLDGVWYNIYVRALSDIKQLELKAIATNSSHYKAIAQILKAINIGLATDLYGDVPYTEATQGAVILQPKYDSQQSVYIDINRLLDEAIVSLNAPNTSLFAPQEDDLVYQGNITKWIKAAYSFKARFQLHLVEVNGTSSYNAVLTSLTNGFASNSDDFQLQFNSVNLNPWYKSQLGLKTGNASYFISKHFISYMNGSQFPFIDPTLKIDPRMLALVDTRTYPNYINNPLNPNPLLPASYIGAANGQGGAGGANSRIGIDNFYSKADSKLVIMSFSEAKFIEAESNFILAGGSPTTTGTNAVAYSAYISGITANMNKLIIPVVDMNLYMNDPSINKGAATLKLNDIMRQKFITLFLNVETFNDYRRYNFSSNAFKNLTLPADASPDNAGNWITRFVYSSQERSTNSVNYSANFKSMVTKVWWDR